MNPIDSYEKFCKAFKGNSEESKRAELLLFQQDWIVRIIDNIDEESMDYSLDKLLIENSNKLYLREAKKDALSRLVDDSFDAVRRISENMRENIIRENVKMPVYKVQEVNSYGLNWLSRRPGATIKEKISSSNSSMMAVQRRMSLDTGENRLYIAYLKEIADLLQTKIDNFQDKQEVGQSEKDFCSRVSAIIRNPDLDEIRRWENMPPNNTLLSDQNYKKIWRCWNELKQIDDLLKEDNEKLSERLCTLFYVEFLTKASRMVRFPQISVGVDYETYSVTMFSKLFYGVDDSGNVLKTFMGKNVIKIEYQKIEMELLFIDDKILMMVNGQKVHDAVLTSGSIFRYVEVAITKLGLKNKKTISEREFPKAEKSNSVIMDIFSLRPRYILDNNPVAELKGRLLFQQQELLLNNEKEKFYIPCDMSDAIIIRDGIETFSIATTVENASSQQMSRLFHLLEQYIVANKFTFVFPDIYNEFQLSLVHKAARLVFHEVRSLPRSISTAFSYMDSISFANTFEKDDFLLVLDVVDDDVSMTLIQGLYDENVEEDIPEYGGVIWERHPSVSFSIHEEIEELTDKLLGLGCIEKETVYRLFGLDGLKSENSRLITIFDSENFFDFSDEVMVIVKNFKINITEKINSFLIGHREVIGNSKTHIVSLSNSLMYKGNCCFEYLDLSAIITGCSTYEILQNKSSIILWRDHLPGLAIKLLYGRFNLVDNETITPEFNVEKKIRIPNEFTLSKNTKEYHFDLVQNDLNRKTRYAAVVKNPAFPLNHDVRCRLDMTYQYGAEEAYRLLFIPVEGNAGFVEAKVSWEKVSEHPYKNLDAPDPISSLPWNEMRSFTGRNGQVDLISELINKLEAIEKGYQSINISQFDISMRGEPGKRSFLLPMQLDGKPGNVIFVESNVERQKIGRQMSFNHMEQISFEVNEASDKGHLRYRASLEQCFSYGTVWVNKGHGYACYPYLNIDDKSVKVAFFESQFDHPEDFYTGITNVSFEVVPYNDIYKAIKIHDEDSDEPYEERKNYFAVNIRKGAVPGQFIYNGWMYFIMLSMFMGKNSFYDSDCPSELRSAFDKAKEAWIDMLYKCDNDYVKMRIFNLLSLVADDLGEEYYSIAEDYVENYLNGQGKLPDYIGYAIGDCTKDHQKSLLESLYELNDEKVVCILSKAIWGNEEYLWNVPVAKTLKYFDVSVHYLCELCNDKGKNGKDVTMCLEYILGVFRLRKYNDNDLNYRLSMNNPLIQKLYEQIEIIIENNIEIRSFLTLEVKNKGIYENIPDLLYAILVYITGEKGAGDIKIAGLALDDIDV